MTFALRSSAVVLAIVLAIAAAYPATASAATAGIAQFAAGDVTLRRGGADDKLVKGRNLESGDVIETGAAGHAQIRFSDGGLVSLQPGTLFNIKKYADENDPKKDTFLVDLFRGSMRAVTGLIGKRNRDNYQVTTQTATIGIRGSAFFAGYNPDGSLSVSTEKDEIVVCTNGGCTGLTVGESVRVTSNGEIPARTNNRTSFQTEQPKQDPTAAANKTDADGQTVALAKLPAVAPAKPPSDRPQFEATDPPTIPSSPPVVGPPSNGNFNNLHSDFITPNDRYSSDFHSSTSTFSADKMSQAVWSYGSHTITFQNVGQTIVGDKVGSIANKDFIGWGYWTQAQLSDSFDSSSSTQNKVHYLVGIPSSSGDLPTHGTANYAFAGGAAVSDNFGPGSVTGATLSINFSSGKFTSVINTQFGALMVPVNMPTNRGAVQSDGTMYGASGDVFMKGFVAGNLASTAGLLFRYHDAPIAGTITGAAVFNQASSSGLR